MSTSILWNENTAVTDFDIDVPAWIEQDISAYDVAAIVQGGCSSGAYMPAVTYYTAGQTMATHGDDVLDYIQDATGELPPADCESWTGMACLFLSAAVEIWANSVEGELSQAIEDAQEQDAESE